jgi:putative cell wall-binding protein
LSIRPQRKKRSFAAVLAAAMIASVLALIASPASATSAVTQKRLSGLDRYATAAAVAENAYPSASKAILVSGESFADALSSAGLAGSLGAPIFLTQQAALPAVTAAAMGRVLGSSKAIYVVGGEAAVGAGVVTTLTGLGYTVTRLSGADRYATAAAVATKSTAMASIGTMSGIVTCILVSGIGYADGLAAGPLAVGNKMPILLTDPNTLSAATTTAITANGCKQMLIVGGTSSVSAAVATAADAIAGVSVVRVSGADRYATSIALAQKAYASIAAGGLAWTKTQVSIARGDSFADALAASQLSHTVNTPLLLVQAGGIGTGVSAELTAKSGTMAKVFVIGGTSAISAATAQAADDAATIAGPTATITGVVVGSNSATVTYSAKMSGAATLTNYLVNNTAVVIVANVLSAFDDGVVADAGVTSGGVSTCGTVAALVSAKFKVGNKVTYSNAWVNPTLPGLAAQTSYVTNVTSGTRLCIAGDGGDTTAAATISSAPLACSDATGVTVCTIYVDSAFAAGDVFSTKSTGITATATSIKVPVTSATAAAVGSTSVPTATVECFTTSADATRITFSEPVNAFLAASITETDAGTVASWLREIGTNTYIVTWSAAPAAGSTITVDMSTVTSARGIAGSATVDATGTCQSSTAKPVANSGTFAVTNSAHATKDLSDTAANDTVSLTMTKAGTAPGVLGNAYKVGIVDTAVGTSAASAAVNVTYNTSTKTFSLNFDTGANTLVTATQIAAAFNVNADFAALAAASVKLSAGGTFVTADGGTAAASFASGVSSVAVTVTMSDALRPYAGDVDHAAITLSGTTATNRSAATAPVQAKAFVLAALGKQLKLTYALTTTEYVNYPAKGSSTVYIPAGDLRSKQDNATSVAQTVTLN